jgi:hypothetical protein
MGGPREKHFVASPLLVTWFRLYRSELALTWTNDRPRCRALFFVVAIIHICFFFVGLNRTRGQIAVCKIFVRIHNIIIRSVKLSTVLHQISVWMGGPREKHFVASPLLVTWFRPEQALTWTSDRPRCRALFFVAAIIFTYVLFFVGLNPTRGQIAVCKIFVRIHNATCNPRKSAIYGCGLWIPVSALLNQLIAKPKSE